MFCNLCICLPVYDIYVYMSIVTYNFLKSICICVLEYDIYVIYSLLPQFLLVNYFLYLMKKLGS